MSIFGGECYLYFYVNDLLFWANDEADITQVSLSLRNKGVYLRQKDVASGFLEVEIYHDAKTGKF